MCFKNENFGLKIYGVIRSSLEPAPDLLDLLRGLEHHLNTHYDPLTDLAPTDWGPTFPPVDHLEGRSIYGSVVTMVIRKVS